MGTIADVVRFQMLKPLTGATVKPLAPINIEPASGQPDTGGLSDLQKAILQGQSAAEPSKSQPTEQPVQPVQPTWNQQNPQNAPLVVPTTQDVPQQAPVTQGSAPAPVTWSDENLKTNIKEGDPKLDHFLSTIGAHEYEYKDEKHGVGKFVSPMAQELEKTTIGKSAVINTKEGKMVDYSRLLGASLSALSLHHKDIKELQDTMEYLKKVVDKRKS